MTPRPKPLSPQSSVLGPSSRSRGARTVARDVLLKIEQDGAFADELLDDALHQARLDSRDRALVFELVYGVLRHRGTLDWRLAHVSDRPLGRLPNHVKAALRLGAYQLLYLEKIPPSAAVNESVALVKGRAERVRAGTRRDWTGFVNAVLRSLLRVPVPPWPDPDKDPVAALSIRYSCPAWLVERWLKHVGLAQAEARCRATLAIPPLTIRVNILRVSRDALERDLLQGGYQVRRTLVSPVGLVLEKCGPV
ncbi:MAG: transcription antitermination factor NusB, partial [Nitrospiraceae bacterium]